MNKFRIISIFLESLNDEPKLVRCSDSLMVQLVKFTTSITLNVAPVPFKFFATQLIPSDERRFCQFEFDPSNPSHFKLFYMFELDNNTIQLRTFNNSFNFENWDPFHQGTLESNFPPSFFNFSMMLKFESFTDWSYFYSEFGSQEYIQIPQMSILASSTNSNGDLVSLSGISLFTKKIAEMIEKIPCEVMNSSSFSSSSPDKVETDINQNAFVKYALLIAKEKTVIIEKDIGAIEPLKIVDNLPTFPRLDQLNSPFWFELNKIIFQHGENEVFEFYFDRVLYLVAQTSVSSIKASKIKALAHEVGSIPTGIINKIINSIKSENESHIFIACFPVDPSVQSVYYPMSIIFILGISVLCIIFFLSLCLIQRENLWRIRKIALQTPKFTPSLKNEYPKIHHGTNDEILDDADDLCRYFGYLPKSIMNIRNFQLEYPDDAILNKALDATVENLTLRDDQKLVLMKKDSCEFCKYFLPEKVDFQTEQISISNKKSGKLSKRLTNLSHKKSNSTMAENEDSTDNGDDSDNDDINFAYNSKVNLNANIENETDESLYKIWKMMSFPFIQVMSNKKDDDVRSSVYNIHRGKASKNKFVWEKFLIDRFLPDPHRMLIKYMMTLLNDCQLFFPPFDPMCVANLLITIDKGINNPIHAAHELFTVHQVVYGPFVYWLTNKLDILVLFFAVYFSHFDYRLYTLHKIQQKNQNNEFNDFSQITNDNDNDNTNNLTNPTSNQDGNDINMTMEGFRAFDDDFSKIEENLKEIKALLFQIFPIRNLIPKTVNEINLKRHDSSLYNSFESSNSDIPDSQSIPNMDPTSNSSNNDSCSSNVPQIKEKPQNKKTSSNPPSFQNLKKFTINKRSYSNIGSQGNQPESLAAATTESETENTDTQTTDTVTSLSFTINAIESEPNFESTNSRTSDTKRLSDIKKNKKKKHKEPFWYFWKTLKQVMYKTCIKSESFELLGKMRVRIQSPSIDIHNDYGDKLLFMESVLKLCEVCGYWSPVEVMDKCLKIYDSILFSKEEISDKMFISSFHLEYAQKIALPWIQMLAIFKPQAFEDVIKNLTNVIQYWTMKLEEAQDSAEEVERESNLAQNDNFSEDQIKKDNSVNDKINNESSNEYNYSDND